MRHVIWDWNGTLVDDLSVVVDAVNVSLASVSAAPIDADGYRDNYMRPVRCFYDRVLKRPVTDEEWLRIDATFHDTYCDGLGRVALTGDAERAIGSVAKAGATQSILSMWWHDELVPEVERHGLDSIMARVDGNTLDAGETKARLLEIHLTQLDVSESAAMIGDAIDDALAAIEVGIPIVLYDGGSHHRAELDAMGVPVASSLCEAAELCLDM